MFNWPLSWWLQTHGTESCFRAGTAGFEILKPVNFEPDRSRLCITTLWLVECLMSILIFHCAAFVLYGLFSFQKTMVFPKLTSVYTAINGRYRLGHRFSKGSVGYANDLNDVLQKGCLRCQLPNLPGFTAKMCFVLHALFDTPNQRVKVFVA